jgi:hypothetical protein
VIQMLPLCFWLLFGISKPKWRTGCFFCISSINEILVFYLKKPSPLLELS